MGEKRREEREKTFALCQELTEKKFMVGFFFIKEIHGRFVFFFIKEIHAKAKWDSMGVGLFLFCFVFSPTKEKKQQKGEELIVLRGSEMGVGWPSPSSGVSGEEKENKPQ